MYIIQVLTWTNSVNQKPFQRSFVFISSSVASHCSTKKPHKNVILWVFFLSHKATDFQWFLSPHNVRGQLLVSLSLQSLVTQNICFGLWELWVQMLKEYVRYISEEYLQQACVCVNYLPPPISVTFIQDLNGDTKTSHWMKMPSICCNISWNLATWSIQKPARFLPFHAQSFVWKDEPVIAMLEYWHSTQTSLLTIFHK